MFSLSLTRLRYVADFPQPGLTNKQPEEGNSAVWAQCCKVLWCLSQNTRDEAA